MTWKPTKWQQTVLNAPEPINLGLFGGRGRGATSAAIALMLRTAQKYPNSKQLFIRTQLRSLGEVMDNLQMLAVGAFGKGVKVNRSENTFKFPNGSIIEFAPLSDQMDISKLQGRSFEVVYCDEYGNCTPAQMRYVDQIRANLRGTSGCPVRFVLLGNPAGAGHQAIVSKFINKLPAFVPTVLADGTEWLYLPATFRENAYLPATYETNLSASAGRDGELARAWADGDWSVAKGAILADVMDQEKQMFDIKNLGFGPNDRGSHLFLSGDFGISSPSIVFLCSHLLAPLGKYPRGSLIFLDEVSSAMPDDLSVGQQWSVSMLADRVNEMCNRYDVRNRSGVLDDFRGLDATVIEIMQRFGLHFVKPQKGRIDNLAAMREMLFNSKTGNNRPGIWASSLCHDFWETIPILPRDPLRHDLPNTAANDHAFDAASYGCDHIPRIVRNRYYIP
jgi:Terminase large subunit, T4likevirus-type, N-terminal